MCWARRAEGETICKFGNEMVGTLILVWVANSLVEARAAHVMVLVRAHFIPKLTPCPKETRIVHTEGRKHYGYLDVDSKSIGESGGDCNGAGRCISRSGDSRHCEAAYAQSALAATCQVS